MTLFRHFYGGQRQTGGLHFMRTFTSWIKSYLSNRSRQKMEITSKNFEEKLPLIEASIDEAYFVAIDGEFTGLCTKSDAISGIDTPAERYSKAQKTATKFLLVQFGLCTFHYDPKTKVYSNRAFNFYVWPRPFSRAAPDPRFLSQASSIDFLTRQNFDFNKLFRDGISYLNTEDEKRLRGIGQEKRDMRRQSNQFSSPSGGGGQIPIPAEHKAFIDDATKKVKEWLMTNLQPGSVLHLDKCNPFLRKLIYQTLRMEYGNEIFLETVDRDVIAVTKMNAAEIEKREADRDRVEIEELDVAVGFSKVIRKISSSGKLVVGHNMLLDLCFTVNQFITHLPETYMEFKLLMQTSLPKVCDTKLMASIMPFREEIRSSALEELLKTVSAAPYQIPDMKPDTVNGLTGYSLGETNEKYHEAGYDAFITGLCFIAMANRLGQIRDGIRSDIQPDDPAVVPFLNKLFLMLSNDIPYMNLAGKDIDPNRDDVFHITFPAEWATSDIQNLFFPFGGIITYWLSDTTAFVRLRETVTNAKIVVPATLNGSGMYNIMAYAQFKSMENVYGNTTGITPTMEKANLTFSPGLRTTPSPLHRHPAARLPVRLTGPSKVAQLIHEEEEESNGKSTTEQPVGKKRSASPEQDLRKRNKSVEEGPSSKKSQNFEEPPWE